VTRRRIEELLSREGPRIRKRFRQVMQRVKDSRTLAQLETALVEGRIAEVLDDVEAAARATATRVEATRQAVSHEVADRLSQDLGKVVSFDSGDTGAVAVLRENRIRLVTGITEQQREAILDVLIDGTNKGINPRQMAVRIRDSIGLTRKQAQAVTAYRESLERPTPLNSDTPPDPEVPPPRPAKARTPEQIDRMVEKHAARQLAHRAEVIARTEAKAAVHDGQELAYQQAIDRGVLEADTLVRTWHAGVPPRTRPHHAVMNGQVRKWGEEFESGLGNKLRWPGDPRAPKADRSQCRCAVSTKVVRPAKVAKGAPVSTIMIAGWSGTGKTTLGRALAEQLDIPLLSTDDFIGLGWSEASAHVAELLADGVPRVVEGVAVPRVLRKLLAAAPDRKPCDQLLVLTVSRRPQTPRQLTQGRGHDTVLVEVMPALQALGVVVEVEPPTSTGSCSAPSPAVSLPAA
jgi:hypothetical protein